MRTPTALLTTALAFVIGCEPQLLSQVPDDGPPAPDVDVELEPDASPGEADAGPAADADGDDAPADEPLPSGDAGPAPDPADTADDAADDPPLPSTPPLTPREPIELAPEQYEQWVWIDMPEMRCSKDERGGFAVNFTTASRDLLIYLQGGGICYDVFTCLFGGAPSSVGDDPLFTAIEPSIREYHGVFNRQDADNPLRDSNFVVLPHCTGDHHTGDRVTTYGGVFTYHHVGYRNVTRMLERVAPTFADASRVVLSGFSAGGVGITANYHQIATAFESTGQPPPDLIIDSGPFLRPPFLTGAAQTKLRNSWALDDTVGAFCPSCLSEGFHDLYRVNGALHPGLRSSLVCSYDDNVVELLYSVMNVAPFAGAQMRAGLHDLADWGEATFDPTAASQHRVFYYEGTRHGALQIDPLTTTTGLKEFIEGQLGDGDWPSVRP